MDGLSDSMLDGDVLCLLKTFVGFLDDGVFVDREVISSSLSNVG